MFKSITLPTLCLLLGLVLGFVCPNNSNSISLSDLEEREFYKSQIAKVEGLRDLAINPRDKHKLACRVLDLKEGQAIHEWKVSNR